MGRFYEAMESPPDDSSAASLEITRTPDQRMKHWPAGFLILLVQSCLDEHLKAVLEEDEREAFLAWLQKGYVDYIQLQDSWGTLPQPERRKLNHWHQDLSRLR